jgi:hypothetical protein
MKQFLGVALSKVCLTVENQAPFTQQHSTTPQRPESLRTKIVQTSEYNRENGFRIVGVYPVGRWAESNLLWNQKYFGFNATEIFLLLRYSRNINYFQLLTFS